MEFRSKDSEVQFYFDRSKESVITILRSIIGNPRMSDADRMSFLAAIGAHHQQIADLVQQKLREGEEEGYRRAAAVLSQRV